MENALERNEKNDNIKTKPKFLSESISVEQENNQIKLNPLSHANVNDLNICQILGSSKTFSFLSYGNNSNMFTTKVEKETELLLEENNWKDLFSKKSQKKDGKCLLPREWRRVFSKKLAIMNKFCCIAFDHHSLCKRQSIY